MEDEKCEPTMNPAQSETPGMSGNSMRENREAPLASGSSRPDRLEKATSYTTSMHAGGESDERVVPAKHPNNGEQSPAEGVEGSRSTKGNAEETYTLRTPSRERVSQGLGGVREAARRDKKQKVTALLHHVTVDLLRDSYHSLKREAAPGVDGVTWEQYGEGVEERLQDLHDRIHRGARPKGRPGPTVEENVYTQSRWPSAAIRDRRAGGQDRSTGRGDGSQRDL
jgi:RNA-directed DNA polymerase